MLITAALAAHLLAVNLASAGPLVAASLWRWRGDGVDWQRWASIRLTDASFAALVAGSALGAALLAVPSPELRAALARFPQSLYWYAGVELVFSAACLALTSILQRRGRINRWGVWALALLSSSNLIYHFPPLMAVFGELIADAQWTREAVIDRTAMLRLWMRPEILALWTHFTFAAIATAAVFALCLIQPQPAAETPGSDQVDRRRLARRLAATAFGASLLQIPVGVWLVVVSDHASRSSMMGGSLLVSVLFLSSLLATLALLQTLLNLALGDQTPAATRRAAWLLGAIVLLMTGVLRFSRAQANDLGIDAPRRHAGQGRAAVTSLAPPLPPLPLRP